jgi:hypothetical protein
MARPKLPTALVWIVTLGAAQACGVTTGPDAGDAVLGTWNWVESTGGIAGITLTPASTGDSVRLRFTDQGEAQRYLNGALDRAVGFTTVPGSNGAVEIRYDEPLSGFETQTATFPGSQALMLTDPCCDGFVSSYVRLP